jgi:hypothetical protein
MKGRLSDWGFIAVSGLPGTGQWRYGIQLFRYSGGTVREFHSLSYYPAQGAGSASYSIINKFYLL